MNEFTYIERHIIQTNYMCPYLTSGVLSAEYDDSLGRSVSRQQLSQCDTLTVTTSPCVGRLFAAVKATIWSGSLCIRPRQSAVGYWAIGL